jgi:hypothetical protein
MVRGNVTRIWVGFENPWDVWEEEEFLRRWGSEERGKEFWIGVRPHSSAIGKASFHPAGAPIINFAVWGCGDLESSFQVVLDH